MGIKYYGDYTLEELEKERQRHKELHPAPFKLEDFTEAVCKKFGGEWEEKSWGDTTCTISNVEGIIFGPSKITIGVKTADPYANKFIEYNGNYDLLFDFYSGEGGEAERIGSVSLVSLNDKFFSEVRKKNQELKIPFNKQKSSIYFPSDCLTMLKMKLIDPESGSYRCSVPNIHGHYEKVDCLEFDMQIFPKKEESKKE